MELVTKAEKQLAEWFKGAPHLSDSARESLAKAWPWIAVVFGVLQVLAAWGLYGLTQLADRYFEAANIYTAALTGETVGLSATDKTFIYLAIAVLLVDAVILLMAYKPLKERARRGWDLLFLASLINVAYGVVTVFVDGRGLGSLVWSMIGSAVGFYLLFEVQNKFAKK